MTGPTGNSVFCFASTSMFQNSLFPLWPVSKCLIKLKEYKILTRKITFVLEQPES